MDDQILFDNDYEDFNVSEEENIIPSTENTEELLVYNAEEVNIGDYFFQGVMISGSMLMMSIGLVVVLKLFHRA